MEEGYASELLPVFVSLMPFVSIMALQFVNNSFLTPFSLFNRPTRMLLIVLLSLDLAPVVPSIPLKSRS
jgi:hypothetical protein